MNPPLMTALTEWKNSLGAETVLTGSDLDAYRANCLSIDRAIPAALRPLSEAEVIQIVQIAARHRVPLYTVSTGHNWGYGTAMPVVDDCVLVDLSRMKRVLDFDPELGLVTLEPGVTQQQLYDFLRERNANFFVPTVGAGRLVSVVGNALERGFGMTPFEDHFAAVTSLRAVLPNGQLYRPHMAEKGAMDSAGAWKWGLGPYVDGLFAQGNFGIVTALQIALAKRSEHSDTYFFALKPDVSFSSFVEKSRGMLQDLRGSLGPIKFINRTQLQMTLGTSDLGFGMNPDFEWMGFGVIRAKTSMVRSLRKEVDAWLGRSGTRLRFMNSTRTRFLASAARRVPGRWGDTLRQQIERIQQTLRILDGIPGELELKLVYQYASPPAAGPQDPIRDGVGLIWYAPIIPLKGAVMEQMAVMISATLKEHGFGQAVSFTTLNERCTIGVIPVIYRRPEESVKAQACFLELWKRGEALGCVPYRLPVTALATLSSDPHSVYWKTVETLKKAIDPDGILSPRRYSPR